MRKFKFVGTKADALGYGKKQPSMGTLYNEDEVFSSRTVLEWAEDYFCDFVKEWQEVFEEPTLQDRIQELKDFAKGQGLKVDVVVDKLPKRVEVDPNSLDSISKAFNKCSDLETNKFKVFLAKQLEKYLNGEV